MESRPEMIDDESKSNVGVCIYKIIWIDHSTCAISFWIEIGLLSTSFVEQIGQPGADPVLRGSYWLRRHGPAVRPNRGSS
jgi:hypothetical protein